MVATTHKLCTLNLNRRKIKTNNFFSSFNRNNHTPASYKCKSSLANSVLCVSLLMDLSVWECFLIFGCCCFFYIYIPGLETRKHTIHFEGFRESWSFRTQTKFYTNKKKHTQNMILWAYVYKTFRNLIVN